MEADHASSAHTTPPDPVFVLLSKTLDVLVAPLSWSIALAALGLALRGRRPRLAAAAAALGLAVLVIFSLEPVADRLDARVEAGAPTTFRPGAPYDAMIVLTGMVDDAATRRSGELELTAAADRIVRAATLLRAGAARDVLLTGGSAFPEAGDVPEAERLRDLLVALGIEPGRIVVEGRSRNTRENAAESARVVAARGWRRLLLVTSAAHAPRALGCFRAVGLDPDLLAVDRRAGDGTSASWLPRSGALARSTAALREAAGRVVYRLRGWTAAAPAAPGR
jgi:uncharacterized SAM-binding protein YcdF (DUF218 family)